MRSILSLLMLAAILAPRSASADAATPISDTSSIDNVPVTINRFWINNEKRTSCKNHVVIPVMLWNFTNISAQPIQTIRFDIEIEDSFGDVDRIATDISGTFAPNVMIQGRGDIMAQLQGDGRPKPIHAIRIIKVLWADGTVWRSPDKSLQEIVLYKPSATETMSCH